MKRWSENSGRVSDPDSETSQQQFASASSTEFNAVAQAMRVCVYIQLVVYGNDYLGMTTEDTRISQSSYDKSQCTDDKLNTIPVYSTNTTKTEQTVDKI